MSVAWVGAGIAAVGTISSANAASKATKAQSSIANKQLAVAERELDHTIKMADQMFAFNQKVYDEGTARQKDIDAVNKEVAQTNLNIAKDDAARASETYDFYKTNGRPVVEKTLQEAQNYDSAQNIDAARGRAVADVAQASGAAEASSQRTLSRLGVNASAGRFMELQRRLQAERTATMAGAATNAEQGIRDQAIGMRQQASNIAQGMPAISSGQNGQAIGAGVSAAGVAGAGGAQSAALGRAALTGMDAASGVRQSGVSQFSSMANGASNALGGIAAGANANMAGWANFASQFIPKITIPSGNAAPPGWNVGNVGTGGGGPAWPYANGGKIEGPGTGTSDSIPAVNQDTGQPIKLSNGEYVISADVVKAKGVEFFDNLQKRYHTPVNVGRSKQ